MVNQEACLAQKANGGKPAKLPREFYSRLWYFEILGQFQTALGRFF
jgi:hypothetical protein